MSETPLVGGNVTAGVVRVGETVRRPMGAWSPAVHALLRHLEAKGFAGAPRVLGVDERGREILSYVEGEATWPWEAFAPLATDAGLLRVAELIAGYHAAVADFVPPPDAQWSRIAPASPPETLCHNDLAPWNLIVSASGEWVIIDWDLAAPGSRLSDLAGAARNFAPLFPWAVEKVDIVRRLRLLAEAWEVGPAALVEAIARRTAAEFAGFRERAGAGLEPWRMMWDAGHGKGNAEIAAFVAENAERWRAALG